MINMLPIPHHTQQGNLYAGDCGPACLLMLTPANTFEQAYKAMDMQPGKWAHIYENLRRGLLFYGIKSEYARLPVFEIREKLEMGMPVICLIGYGNLPDELRRSNYGGAHYVIAAGYDDDHVLIHDPLGSGQNGAYIPYPDLVLHRAMRDVPGTAYDFQCLVVEWEVGETAVSDAMALKTIYNALGVNTLAAALARIRWLGRGSKKRLHEPL